MTATTPDPLQPRVDRRLVLRLRRVPLRRRRGGGAAVGGAESRVKGRGLEYVESRAYEPGDDVRHIDWAVTARTGTPHTKLYHEEHTRRLRCYVDVSDSMRFGGARRSKLETAISAAAGIAAQGVAARDTVEVVLFAAAVLHRAAPVRREADLWRLVGELEALPHIPGAQPLASSATAIAGDLRAARRRPDVVFVISDFVDLDGGAVDAAPLWHDDVRPLQVLSHLERVPPALRLTLYDAERGGGSGLRVRRVEPAARIWGRAAVLLDDWNDLAPPLERALRGARPRA